MAEVFVVAYDGIDRHAVDFAIERARKDRARLHIVHVLEWSPYSFLTPQDLAERHKHRQEELARANSAVLDPIVATARNAGVEVAGEVRHGHCVDVICDIAREQNASIIVVKRSRSLSERVFGSVASGLAQCAPVPVVIVP
jgi:nucleotide-binding universal stress UspA family protein